MMFVDEFFELYVNYKSKFNVKANELLKIEFIGEFFCKIFPHFKTLRRNFELNLLFYFTIITLNCKLKMSKAIFYKFMNYFSQNIYKLKVSLHSCIIFRQKTIPDQSDRLSNRIKISCQLMSQKNNKN